MELELPARALPGLLPYGPSRVPTSKRGLRRSKDLVWPIALVSVETRSGAGLTSAPPLLGSFPRFGYSCSFSPALDSGVAPPVAADHDTGGPDQGEGPKG